MNLKEIADAIEKKAGVSILDLPFGQAFMSQGPDGKMYRVQQGKPWPLDVSMGSVFALFQTEEVVRVYVLPIGEEGKAPPKEPPSRHTISRLAPSIFTEYMTGEAFIDEVANECVMLAEDSTSAEKERAAIVEYLRTATEASGAASFGHIGIVAADRIEAGAHIEQDEEDEEDEIPEKTATTPAAAPS